ncbi:MAG TPA: hypothetical protein VGE72_01510 [Azospirillum sp.]
MDISPTGAPAMALPDPMAAALAGVQNAQARASAATEQLASGNLDPAVILDVTSAQLDFAVNAKVLQTTNDMTKKLLDVTA